MLGASPSAKRRYVYAQVACQMTEEDLAIKNVAGLFMSGFGLFICVTIQFTTTYIRNRDAINEKLYNMNFITVDKFTVQGRISSNMYRIFKAENMMEKRPTKEFARSLTLAIEASLMESGLSEEQSKVADLTFSFDNGRMIKLLQYRA